MSAQPPELMEKDFIQKEPQKNPFPFWLWLFLLTSVIALLWGGNRWYIGQIASIFKESPFLQVTNRDLSLFLWQNPEFMRANAKQKGGYLPGFLYMDNVTMDLAAADQFAVAPPEVLFRYHTWNRLVKEEFISRPINSKEFSAFLDAVPEWQPTYWPNAPKEYVEMVKGLSSSKENVLNLLSKSALPLDVRIAFQGWKNFFKEGEVINQVKPTHSEMQQFISIYPHYARNYWRNIVVDSTPDYLKSLNNSAHDKDAIIPSNEMSSFLRVAIYNYLQANRESFLKKK